MANSMRFRAPPCLIINAGECRVGGTGAKSFVRHAQLCSETVGDSERQGRIGREQLVETFAGELSDDAGNVGDGTRGTTRSVDRGQFAELVAGVFDAQQQLPAGAQRSDQPDLARDQCTDVV